ncbi:Methyltransferase domain protein [Pseudovibrio axinellae]|uniref:Methyltransferase domain protein n=1 Tax=Pseudovibrio axinellae TaxID=989403 RepID=A0A165X2I7_9HYPH|nr:FkbM family methyltransferase [Pseudovibrio axinellae]KZL17280.1 Methyltransferase domain protein [Pseudovibrio axinellae]SEQ18499.1 methyltransferase, FkbM family [Pseudovibrio axinellae]
MLRVKDLLEQYHSETSKLKRRRAKSLFRYYLKHFPRTISSYVGLTRGIQTNYGVWLTPNIFDATFRLCTEGSYGTFFSNYLANYKHPFLFLDIGANQGLYSLLAAQNANCVEAFAFEPVSRTFKLLEKNISLNQTAARIAPVQVAISDQSRTADIFLKKTHSGSASLNRHMTQLGKKSEKVQLIAAPQLDKMVTQETDILVKLDVEGHEETVLQELVKTRFFSQIQSIFYEVDERWSDPQLLQGILKTEGFQNFQRIGDHAHHDILASR